MRLKLIGACIVLALAGCAGEGQKAEGLTFGEVVVATVVTPVMLAAKAGVCATTVAIAVPVGAFGALAPRLRERTLDGLAEGVDQNCGPPYVATAR
jgi:hypothetical protein